MDQLRDFFARLFETADWPPRWHCGQWTQFHGWLYIVSDLLIWSAYFLIPLIILQYVNRKHGRQYARKFLLLAAFMLASGATHFLDAIAFWIPAYRIYGLVRFITGILSWVVVFQLIRLLPLAFSSQKAEELEKEIEERKKAQEEIKLLNASLEERVNERTNALLHSEKKYRHLFESNPMPMWVFELQTFRFLDVNDAALTHYGYTYEEFLSMNVSDIRPEEEVKRFLQAEHPIVIHRQEYNRGIWKHRKKDGTLIDVEIIAHDIDFEGRKARFILSNDITARLKTEDALRQSLQEVNAYKEELGRLNVELEDRVKLRTAQLEALNKEMEAFSYSVSHDLRAPLRGIIGYTSMLEEDYADKLDNEAKRITGVIQKNTIRMSQLIDGLLSFSRMTRQDISKAPIEIDKLVAQVVAESGAGPQVTWHIQPLPPAFGDLNTLRQVWINLISNALKYSGKKEHPSIEIGSFPENGQMIYFVKDNGVGFDNKYRDKLFKVFQRLHSHDEFEGTGVGLALVEKIIAKHGGKIWADGIRDKGACFYFSLPFT